MEETVSYSIKTPDGVEHPDILMQEGASPEDILAKAKVFIEENLLGEGHILSSLEIMDRLPINLPTAQE